MHKKLLHEVSPREQNGRDAVARFKAQYRAAAFQCLELLKDKEVVAIYCDLHDDYVVKKIINKEERYDFFQVKTNDKKGFQWKALDIYGVKKLKVQDKDSVLDSFFGKLMRHAVDFGESCSSLNIQSNKDFNEEVYEIEEHLKTANGKHKGYIFIKNEFRNIFPNSSSLTDEEIGQCLSKFKLDGSSKIVDIDGGSYIPLSRHAICENSEVDLSLEEVIEILLGLLALVDRRSSGVIKDWNKSEIDRLASVVLDDVLGVMTISPAAYRSLKDGGDPRALKNTSIIQRFFKEVGAADELIEYLCRCKTDYDQWNNNNKHFINEIDFNIFKLKIHECVIDWFQRGCGNQSFLIMTRGYQSSSDLDFVKAMDANVLVGAFLSEVVRLRI